jgi:hypothetical protein
VVFIPDVLLSDDVPDTNGVGFRLDRAFRSKEIQEGQEAKEGRKAALSQVPVQLPGLAGSILDGPVELEAPVDPDALGGFPGALDDTDSERGGIFHPRRSIAGVPGEQHQQAPEAPREPARPGASDDQSGTPVPLPRRRTPKLVSSHGRPVTQTKPRHEEATERVDARMNADEVTELPQAAQAAAHEAQESPQRPGVLGELGELPKRSRSAAKGVPSRREAGDSGDSLTARRGAADEGSLGTGSADRGAEPRKALGRGAERTGATGRSGPEFGEARTRGPAGAEARDGEAPVLPQSAARRDTTPGTPAGGGGTGALPRRVRQASLAPQLKDSPDGRRRAAARPADPEERDADEVRNRMASLQRGWQRGREENASGDEAQGGTAPGTKGDGR